MAFRMNFAAPVYGMPYMWNISGSVGTESSEANRPTDVRLVKLLTTLALALPGAAAKCVPGCRVVPTINDMMDQAQGFWIYFSQVEGKWPTDGKVSVAPKFASDAYYIVRMNLTLFHNARAQWEAVPDHPQCGAALRAELLAPPR